jgi:hypothetical protein
MATVNTLEVKITGDDSNLKSTLGSASLSVAKWGAAAVAAAAAATAALVTSGLKSADALAKQARQLNASSEELMKLRRAGEMAGVSQGQLDQVLRATNTRLGQAMSGSGAASDSLARLGLSAKELANTPLPDRIGKINQALAENVPAAERAAVAAGIFGERGAQAMALIDPDTIAEASRQVDRLGGALTNVEGRMIEQLNDELSQAGVLFTNVSQRVALQFAPLLSSLAETFFGVSEEAGGFREVIEKGFDAIMVAIKHLINGFDFFARGFKVLFNAMKIQYTSFALAIVTGAKAIVQAFNAIPGINLDKQVASLDALSVKMKSLVKDDIQNIKDTLNAPLKGDIFFDKVKEKAEAMRKAAEEAEAKMQGASALGGEGSSVGGAVALKENTELKSFLEDLKRREDSLRHSKMTEVAIEEENHQVRLEKLREFLEQKAITEQQYQAINAQMEEQHAQTIADLTTAKEAEKLEKFKEALEGRIEAIRASGLTEQELELERYALQLENLALFLENKTLAEEEHRALREQLEAEHEHRMTEIAKRAADDRAKQEKQVQDTITSMRQQAFQMGVNLLQQLGSRSRIAAIAAIALEKARAIAQIKIATATASMLAYASQLIPGDPSSIARAKAAAALTNKLGAVQMGLVAATGLLQAASVGSGGASAGSAGGVPIQTQDVGGVGGTVAGVGSVSATRGQVVNIQLVGSMFGRDQVRDLIQQINESIADGSVLRLT